jgi:hypothetical protein
MLGIGFGSIKRRRKYRPATKTAMSTGASKIDRTAPIITKLVGWEHERAEKPQRKISPKSGGKVETITSEPGISEGTQHLLSLRPAFALRANLDRRLREQPAGTAALA